VTLRCPYCHQEFAQVAARCPHCGRAMVGPARLRARTRLEQRRLKEQLRRKAEREKAALQGPNAEFFRSRAVMVPLVILLLLVGGMVAGRARFAGTPAPQASRLSTVRQQLRVLAIACELFQRDCGRYPTTAEGLKPLLYDTGEAGWKGPYVNLVRADPWLNDYRYALTNGAPRLASNGPDGLPDTTDDVVAETPEPLLVRQLWLDRNLPPPPGQRAMIPVSLELGE